jgi:HK97 family phage major capsid protein/HK97 family phage prohead protease
MQVRNSLDFETKFSTTDTGEITATAWPYGSADRVGDVITKGAFSTETRKIPMLWSHDQSHVIGVWDSLEETDQGLQAKGRLLLDTAPRAPEVHALLKAGAVSGVSIGFSAKKSYPRKGGGRNIHALTLHEISIVAVPMHPGARVTSIKDAGANSMTDGTADVADNDAVDQVVDQVNVDEIVKKALDPIVARLVKAETKLNRPAVHVERKDEATEYQKAWGNYIRTGGRTVETKTMIVGSDVNGGYLAPPDFTSEFIRNLVQFSPVRALASVRTTANPSQVYPTRTAVTNAAWRGEAVTVTESEPTFAQLEIPVRELNTYVDISNMLLADSGGSAEAEVRGALEEDFGQKEGLAFISGDGVIAPTGLLTDTVMSYTANVSTSAIGSDPLISLFYALPAIYRGRGTWLMNSKSLAQIRQLKDTTNQYIWQRSLADGQPETILGRPVVEAVDMPDPSSGNFAVIFGDFTTGYRIVDRVGLTVLPNPYSQATAGMTRFHATRRVGAAVIVPTALRRLKMSAS